MFCTNSRVWLITQVMEICFSPGWNTAISLSLSNSVLQLCLLVMKLRGNSECSACCLLAKGPLNKARLVSKSYQVVQPLVYLSFEASQQEFLRTFWALVPLLKKFITTEGATLRFPLLQFVTIASCSFVLHLEQLKLVLLWIRGWTAVSKD